MAPHNWGDLLKGGGINKLQVGEIRTYLKEHKLAQTGDKGMMVARIRVHWEGKGLLVGEKSVYALSMPELKKACAQRGIMPDLTKDELYAALVEKLAGEGSGRGGRQDGGGGARTRSRWPSACWSWERSRTASSAPSCTPTSWSARSSRPPKLNVPYAPQPVRSCGEEAPLVQHCGWGFRV
mmetsp:Transcript_40015/g.127985  ORF Transcript_40015/g.127985 Transcript_40015/m.127985 type:complete len:181 (-) Transcript_40015:72-614(-)